jgi:hypothetical protein
MNARPQCLASQDADAYAHQQGEYDAEDEALSDYVLEHYGPPFAPEFVEEALHKAPFATAKKIAMLPDAATVARHPALAEFRLMELEERCATLEAALQRQFSEPMPPEALRAALAQQPQALEFSADAI